MMARLELTREDPEGDDHERSVAKVEQRRDTVVDVELGVVVKDAVKEHVDRRAARHNEGAPPPVVILGGGGCHG